MVIPWVYVGFLCALALERGAEVALSRAHAAKAFALGALEVGQQHFKLMQALHVSFFVVTIAEILLLRRPWIPALGIPMAVLAVGAQGLRYWAIGTLKERWNTRVIVLPGLRAVTEGPYRWLRHPNYVAVIVELFAVPLMHSAYLSAAMFTLLNAALLRVRIQCEERALRDHCGYDEALQGRSALMPRWSTARARHG